LNHETTSRPNLATESYETEEEMDLEQMRAELESIEDYEEKQLRVTELVAEHGAALAPISFGRWQDGVEFLDPVELGDDAPWSFDTNAPEPIIRQVFEPLAEELNPLVSALVEATRAVVVRRSGDDWRLLFFLERTRSDAMWRKFPGGSSRTIRWMCGAPSNGECDQRVPEQVRRFAQICDGFGPEGVEFGVGSVMPLGKIAPLSEDRPDWLEIYCDSVGNRILHDVDDGDSLVGDWDHETHERAERKPFFAWLNFEVVLELLDLDSYDHWDGVDFDDAQ
jgi:hypothetical protein